MFWGEDVQCNLEFSCSVTDFANYVFTLLPDHVFTFQRNHYRKIHLSYIICVFLFFISCTYSSSFGWRYKLKQVGSGVGLVGICLAHVKASKVCCQNYIYWVNCECEKTILYEITVDYIKLIRWNGYHLDW